MSYTKSFTAGDKTVNAAMASAVQQDELLSLLSVSLMERAFRAAQSGQDITNEHLLPMFMAMPQQLKRQVVTILTGRMFIADTQVPVTIKDFSGQMIEWNTLLAELLQWNLEGFFEWLANAASDVRPAAQVQDNSQV